ncbi:MAG: ABC transporter permease [Candidatus Brocadiales bacterium]|nr:ABC transporter permease [Candidatus Brocadiales bacterium]
MSIEEDNIVGELAQRQPTIVIRPRRGWLGLNLRELWAYRDLLLILAGRDVKVRYKQTFLGVTWVILQPLVTAIIFTVVFGGFAQLPSDGFPYILFVFSGLLPWNLFSASISRAGGSLVGNANLISKVYFPRLLVPLASIGAILIDFAVSFLVLVILMIAYKVDISWRILALPPFLLLALLTAIGVSLWLSALSVYYRDFMFAIPFLIQAWTYASPVAYAMSIVPEKWRWLVSLNPAVGFIEGFRWALLGSNSLTLDMVLISTASCLVFFFSGLYIFRYMERGFADVI